jgi:hypothetical protein
MKTIEGRWAAITLVLGVGAMMLGHFHPGEGPEVFWLGAVFATGASIMLVQNSY